jgi:hypothetical protein
MNGYILLERQSRKRRCMYFNCEKTCGNSGGEWDFDGK